MTNNAADSAAPAEKPRPFPGNALLWRIVVRPVPPKERTSGGIIIPDTEIQANQARAKVCQIVDMGELAYAAETKAGLNFSKDRNKPKVGDYVLIGEFAGQVFQFDGQEHRLVNDTDIMLKVSDPDAFGEYA